MSILFNWRFWVLALILSALAATNFIAYRAGKANVRADWNVDKLAQSETARLREKAITIANQGVDRELQIDKQKRAVADRVTADSLRDFKAALAARPDNTTTTSGTDEPYSAIASECAGALQQLDSYASGLAITAKGLQGYAREVCVSKP